MMNISKDVYGIRQNASLTDLQREATEFLQSIAMMTEILCDEGTKPLSFMHYCLIRTMREMLTQAINVFINLYKIDTTNWASSMNTNSIFQLSDLASQEQLKKHLLDNVYQLNAINCLAVNEMLDSFDDTRGNILLSTATRATSLVHVMEQLCALPIEGQRGRVESIN